LPLDMIDGLGDAGLAGHVEGDAAHADARAREALCSGPKGLGVAAVENEVSTGAGEPAGDGESDTTARPGDKGAFAGQRELRKRVQTPTPLDYPGPPRASPPR